MSCCSVVIAQRARLLFEGRSVVLLRAPPAVRALAPRGTGEEDVRSHEEGTVEVLRCQTPDSFLAEAEAFLLADEACHNLLLGVPATLMARDTTPAPQPYFAVVVETGRIVAAAMMTPPQQLVLSRAESPQALNLIARDLQVAQMMPPGV